MIERVRIICTVYDPETGTYRFKYGLLIEIERLTGTAMAGEAAASGEYL